MSRASYRILEGDCLRILPSLRAEFDAVVVDPPYHLSGGGSTCMGGKRARVDKGAWDKTLDYEVQMRGEGAWIEATLRRLRRPGSLMICANKSNLSTILGVLASNREITVQNLIVWEKPAPPPNLGCRCLTHSHEIVVWATIGKGYYFDYEAMKRHNNGKQLKDVWRIGRPSADEMRYGKHPTQKPISLMKRLVEAVCPPGGGVIDPFCGSATTGIAIKELGGGRHFIGIEQDPRWVNVARRRMHAA